MCSSVYVSAFRGGGGGTGAYVSTRPLLHSVLFLEQHTGWSGIEQQSSGMGWQPRRPVSLCVSYPLPSVPPLQTERELKLPECVWSNHSRWLPEPPWPESIPSPFLCNPFIRGREGKRGFCSKSPLPRFCCMYYAMCFRSLIRMLAGRERAEWECARERETDQYVIYQWCLHTEPCYGLIIPSRQTAA